MKISDEFKIVLFIGCLMLFLYAVYYLKDILTPVFISMFIAYLLDPIVDKLEKRFSRVFSIIILITASLTAVTVIVLFVVPAFITEFNKLAENFPLYLEKIKVIIGKASFLIDHIQEYLNKIVPHAAKVANNIFNNILSLFMNFFNLLLIPIFTFYFLKDFDNMRFNVLDKVPLKFKDKFVKIFIKIDESVSAFVRGQLLICSILAVLYSAGLTIIKLDLALIIGIFSGFATIIPYFGFILGIVFSLIIAFLQFHSPMSLLSVILVFSAVQALESFLITPKILGDKVGLHPVVVILSLMIFGKIFGFIGLIIAIPLASVLKVFYNELVNYYKSSRYYG